MTKEKIVKTLLSREAESYVRRRIEAVQEGKSTSNGVIAGGAVASAFIEFLGDEGKIELAYNDIDIFKPIGEDISVMIKNKSKKSFKKEGSEDKAVVKEVFSKLRTRKENTATMTDIISASGAYGHIYCVANPKIKILGTVRDGLLNTTYMSMNDSTIGLGEGVLGRDVIRQVIERFDINSTQIGYEKNNKDSGLVFTENFVNFLFTRQLEIVRWNTPFHSIARLAKKARELGVYSETEESVMIALGYANSNRVQIEKYEENANVIGYWEDKNMMGYMGISANKLPLNFGEKMKENFKELNLDGVKVIEVPNKEGIYTIETNKSHSEKLLKVTKKWDSGVLFNNKDIEDTLSEVFTGEIKSSSSSSLWKEQTKHSMSIIIPEIYKNVKHAKKSTLKAVRKVHEERDGNNVGFMEVDAFMGFENIKVDDILKFEKLRKFITSKSGHSELLPYLIAMDEDQMIIGNRITIIENIKAVEKQYKVLVGTLGKSHKHLQDYKELLDRSRCEEIAKKALENLNVVHVKNRMLTETKDFRIKQMQSGYELLQEGSAQHNCVAGYISTIKKEEESAIFSLIPKNNKENLKRITLEIRKLEYGDSWRVVQAEGFPVKRINLDDDLVEALQKISEKHKLFPMYFGSYVKREEGRMEYIDGSPRYGKNYLGCFSEDLMSEKKKREIFMPKHLAPKREFEISRSQKILAGVFEKTTDWIPVYMKQAKTLMSRRSDEVSVAEFMKIKISKTTLMRKAERVSRLGVLGVADYLSKARRNKRWDKEYQEIRENGCGILIAEEYFYKLPIKDYKEMESVECRKEDKEREAEDSVLREFDIEDMEIPF